MANVVFYSKMSIESLFISTLLCGDCLYHDHLDFIKIWDLEGTRRVYLVWFHHLPNANTVERALPGESGDLPSGAGSAFPRWGGCLRHTLSTWGLLSLMCKLRRWTTSPLKSLALLTHQDVAYEGSSKSAPLYFKSLICHFTSCYTK